MRNGCHGFEHLRARIDPPGPASQDPTRRMRQPVPGVAEKARVRSGPGNPYLVIDRLDAPDGDYYAQALHRPDGTWIVEYRDGGRNRHYQADASGPGVVYQLLAGWTLQLPGWQRRLTWRPIFQ